MSLNIIGFHVISPIGSLHTYSVYCLLQKIIGTEQLIDLESCWDAYLFDGNPCGTCPKCQRLKYIFKKCLKIDYLSWAPMLDISSADFLFSSIYALHAITYYPEIDFSISCILDEDSKQLSGQFIDLISTKYNLLKIDQPIEIPFIQDKQNWTDLTSQIIQFLGIDYSNLEQNRCNNINVPFLPFERYYMWGRVTKILNCYAFIPIYDSNQKLWKKVCVSEYGPELRVPDLEIFRRWLDFSYIKKYHVNLITSEVNA